MECSVCYLDNTNYHLPAPAAVGARTFVSTVIVPTTCMYPRLSMLVSGYIRFLLHDATQSAVMLQYVVRPSVCPSVMFSYVFVT